MDDQGSAGRASAFKHAAGCRVGGAWQRSQRSASPEASHPLGQALWGALPPKAGSQRRSRAIEPAAGRQQGSRTSRRDQTAMSTAAAAAQRITALRPASASPPPTKLPARLWPCRHSRCSAGAQAWERCIAHVHDRLHLPHFNCTPAAESGPATHLRSRQEATCVWWQQKLRRRCDWLGCQVSPRQSRCVLTGQGALHVQCKKQH